MHPKDEYLYFTKEHFGVMEPKQMHDEFQSIKYAEGGWDIVHSNGMFDRTCSYRRFRTLCSHAQIEAVEGDMIADAAKAIAGEQCVCGAANDDDHSDWCKHKKKLPIEETKAADLRNEFEQWWKEVMAPHGWSKEDESFHNAYLSFRAAAIPRDKRIKELEATTDQMRKGITAND